MAKKEEAASARKRALASVRAYKDVFGGTDGKKVLLDLMNHAGMMKSNFSPDSSHITAFNEGSRAMVCYILERINTDIVKLEKMIEDNYNDNHNIFGEEG